MATSAVAMQSLLASPVSPMTHRSRSGLALTSPQLPRQDRKSNFQVMIRCNAEKRPEEPSPLTSTSYQKKQSTSTKFEDVFAFSGPAPETINGRLAMVGFVAALGVELANRGGDDVVGQVLNGAGLPWFVGTTALLSIASLIPLFKGVSVQSRSDGVFTSEAEMVNGRFAMLGLVAMVFTEFLKGGALV